MVAPAKKADFVSVAEYLAHEEKAEYKSEYFSGRLYMLAGGSPNHNRISGNVLVGLQIQTRRSGCETFNSLQRLKLPSGLLTYPDVTVVCGEIELDEEDAHAITNPVLIVEVLSPSTASYDLGEKFGFYREAESLREYLTIHQDKFHIEQWYKQENGQWMLSEFTQKSDVITLHSINATLPLAQIYERVVWDDEPRQLSRDNELDD